MPLILEFRGDAKHFERVLGAATKAGGAKVKVLEKTSVASAGKMTSAFSSFSKILGPLGLGLGLAGAIVGVKKLIGDTINFADNIGKLSTRLGESTEFLSEMGFVAERSGVTFQAMSVGIQRANRRMAEARQGFGEAKKVLEELDLELNNADGSARNFEQILPDLADKINGLSSDQDKLRIAFKLFDTEGVSFLQFLKSGSKGIEQLRTEARSLGLSLDKDATDRAAQAADALTDFQGATKGLTTEIVLSLLPALSDWTEGMTTLITGFDQARIRARVWAEDQESNTEFLDRQTQALEFQSSKLKASGAAYIELAKQSGAYNKILDLLVATEGLEKNSLDSVNRLLAETIRLRREAKEEGGGEGGALVARKELFEIERSTGEFRRIQLETFKETEIVYGGIVTEAETVNLIQPALTTDAQRWAQQLAFAKAQMEGVTFWANQALMVMRTITELSRGKVGGFLGGVIGGIVGFATGGGPFGALAGFQAGAGIGGQLGFQGGGSFTVPGTGGGDRPFLMNLTPGERVDVTPRNQITNNKFGGNTFNLSFPGITRIDEFELRTNIIPMMNNLVQRGQSRLTASDVA